MHAGLHHVYPLSNTAKQHVLQAMVATSTVSKCTSTDSIFELTTSEVEALKYVAGALVHSMTKTKMSSECAEVVASWVAANAEAGDQNWVQLQSRGKLIEVSDHFLSFLKACDDCCAPILATSQTNCNLQAVLMDAIISNDSVANRFLYINGMISECESIELLHRLVRKYTSVRCKAYVKNLERKRDTRSKVGNNMSKPSSSLRQSLASKRKL
jgi:hypothetical protein